MDDCINSGLTSTSITLPGRLKVASILPSLLYNVLLVLSYCVLSLFMYSGQKKSGENVSEVGSSGCKRERVY